VSSQQQPIDKTAEVSKKDDSEVQKPPQADRIHPRLTMYNYQKIGIPILLLVPILALLGIFGVSTEQVQAENDAIAVTIEYPTRLRYKVLDTIDVRVTNQTDAVLESVIVQFEREYINQFSESTFMPDVSQITEHYYEVELQAIPAGESRHINVTVESERIGYHRGEIVVQIPSSDSLQFQLNTLAFP
jgi:hypothetical protein